MTLLVKEVEVGSAAVLADTQPLQTLLNAQADTSKHWSDPAPLCTAALLVVVLVKSLKTSWFYTPAVAALGGEGDDAEERLAEWLKDNKMGGKWRWLQCWQWEIRGGPPMYKVTLQSNATGPSSRCGDTDCQRRIHVKGDVSAGKQPPVRVQSTQRQREHWGLDQHRGSNKATFYSECTETPWKAKFLYILHSELVLVIDIIYIRHEQAAVQGPDVAG